MLIGQEIEWTGDQLLGISKKQKVISCSSAEAEYRAMLKLTNELVWIKGILEHLEIEQSAPMTMHCDNQAAIHIASNSVFHERTKHIEVDCHKVRQMIILGVILPCYTRSEDQLADFYCGNSVKAWKVILLHFGELPTTKELLDKEGAVWIRFSQPREAGDRL
ncbi:hypothetical protein YC2023_045209 [Brassica napus]